MKDEITSVLMVIHECMSDKLCRNFPTSFISALLETQTFKLNGIWNMFSSNICHFFLLLNFVCIISDDDDDDDDVFVYIGVAAAVLN